MVCSVTDISVVMAKNEISPKTSEDISSSNTSWSSWSSNNSMEYILSTLKQLEYNLTESNRQDVLPKWANEIFMRLDQLENKINKNMNDINYEKLNNGRYEKEEDQKERDDSLGGGGLSVSLFHHTNNEELYDYIQHEINNKTMNIKFSYESKLSSISLEMERLHKLLLIRPTTTEYHLLLNQINQIKNHTELITTTISNDMNHLINLKLSEEMMNITEKLQKNDQLTENSNNLLLQRINDLELEIRKLRYGIKLEFENSEEIIKKTNLETKQFHEKLENLQQEFQQFQFDSNHSHNTLCETIEQSDSQLFELNQIMNQKFSEFYEEFRQFSTSMEQETSHHIDNRLQEIKDNSNHLINEIKDNLLNNFDNFNESISQINQILVDCQEKQKNFTAYTDRLEENNLLNKVNQTRHDLEILNPLIKSHSKSIESLQSTSDGMLVTLQTIQETLDHQIPQMINVETLKIEGNIREIQNIKEIQRQLRNSSLDHENKLLELLKLQEDMVIFRDLYELHEERIKKILQTISNVLESHDINEKRINEFYNLIQLSEEKMYHRISLTKRQTDEQMISQFSDLEQKFHLFRENIFKEIMTTNGNKKLPKSKMKFIAQMALKKNQNDLYGSGGTSSSDMGGTTSRTMNVPLGLEEIDDEITLEKDEKLDQVIQLCISFEDITGYRNISPKEIPSKLCGEIALHVYQLASLLSTSIDIETIKRKIYQPHGPLSSSNVGTTMIENDENPNEMKGKMVQNSIEFIVKKLNEISPSPNSLQLEARNMFLNKIQQALQLAMTKYDQVITTSNTLVGRVKVPTCIACDRPMLSKVAAGDLTQYRSPNKNSNTIRLSPMISEEPSLTSIDTTTSPLQLNKSFSLDEESIISSPVEFLQTHSGYDGDGNIGNGKKKLESVKSKNSLDDISSERKIVHRGGFKMPGK